MTSFGTRSRIKKRKHTLWSKLEEYLFFLGVGAYLIVLVVCGWTAGKYLFLAAGWSESQLLQFVAQGLGVVGGVGLGIWLLQFDATIALFANPILFVVGRAEIAATRLKRSVGWLRRITGNVGLHEAVKRGDVELVRRLVGQGKKVGAKDRKGRTALHLACSLGNVEVAGVLLELGANREDADGEGATPLHFAAEEFQADVVRLLIDNGVHVDARDRHGRTALHALLGRLANVPYARRSEAVAAACQTAEILLKAGADANVVGGVPTNPALRVHALDLAAREHHPAYLLAMSGVDASHRLANVSPDLLGGTVLHLASRYALEAVRELLSRGADVNVLDERGYSPLMVALDELSLFNTDLFDAGAFRFGCFGTAEELEKIVACLVEEGASVTHTTKGGQTPLHLAARTGRKGLLELLLSRGALVDACAADGTTPLFAVYTRRLAENVDDSEEAGALETMRYLKASGAKPQVRLKNGRTVLHAAAASKSSRIWFEEGLAEGVTVDVLDEDGNTPLHVAAEVLNGAAVVSLLELGANPWVRNLDEKLPYDLALSNMEGYSTSKERRRKAFRMALKMLKPLESAPRETVSITVNVVSDGSKSGEDMAKRIVSSIVSEQLQRDDQP